MSYENDFLGTPEGDEVRCAECPHWIGCPCGGCGWGLCTLFNEMMDGRDGC